MPSSTFTYGGREYEFWPEKDLTVSRLRLIESWFPELDGYLTFIEAAAMGDPDALASVIWIARNKAGDTGVPEPRRERFPDFKVGEVMCSFTTDGGPAREALARFSFSLDGQSYTFIPDEVTYRQLGEIKRWYGYKLGRLATFFANFAKWNADAVACAVWIVRKNAGEDEVPDPRFTDDFALGEVLESLERIDPEGGEPAPIIAHEEPPDPTKEAEPPESPRTSTRSRQKPGTGTSQTSPSPST